MPDQEKQSTDVEKDSVNRDDYNKVVESANSTKTELEKTQKELEELKTKETETKKTEAENKIEEEKKAWEKESAEKDKMIEDLKTKAEVKDDSKVSKGVVKEPEETVTTDEQLKEKLNNELGEIPKIDPKNSNDWNRWDRYGHFFNSKTRINTSEQFGKALSLHEGAFSTGQAPLNNFQKDNAKKSSDDIVLKRNSDTITEGQV